MLKIRNPLGQPFIIIGGQAVNFWATRYVGVETELETWRPFTSGDIDFKGNRNDVLHLAQALKVRATLPLSKEMTALAGAIPLKINGASSMIEIVRFVPGLTERETEKHAFEHEFEGATIRVLGPISLLHAKAKLCLIASQKERRDADHVKILFYCVRGFLREALCAAEQSDALMRGWLGAMEKTFGVNWNNILPEKEISKSLLPGVVNFREKRWPIWQRKILSR
ncbi:MAG: hypothetical protein ABJC04_03715 [Verrucomicrobiota bacterium]